MNIETMEREQENFSTLAISPANTPTTTISPSSSSSEGPTDHGDARAFTFSPPNTPQDENDAIPFHPERPQDLPLPAGPLETLTDKDASVYNLNHGGRLAVIFNHSQYKYDRLEPRSGTDQDVLVITEMFEELNFKVETLDNPTVDDIVSKLWDVQKRQDLCIFALFILTHGEADGLLHAYDSSYRFHKTILPELLPDLCPGLAGRPKLIFMQACQGDKTDSGVLIKASQAGRIRHTSTDSSKAANNLPYCIPNFCDLLIFSAAYFGQYSFRSSKGSWFIQALCHEIKESKPEEDLATVLTNVSRNVALNRQSNVPSRPELHKKKQVPLKQDTLIRKVFLKSYATHAIPVEQTVTNVCNKTVTADAKKEANAFRRKDDNCLCM